MTDVTSAEGQRLQAMRSPAFRNSAVANTITQATGSESLDNLYSWARSLWLEFFPQTATWSLPFWEQAYGIVPKDGATTESRRDAIMAKVNASSRCNGAFLRAFVEQQSGGRVASITRITDYVYEIGVTGRSKDLAALNAAIDEVIPAHLQITIIDQALSWAASDGFDLTEGQWDALNLTWAQEEVYNGVAP